MSKTNTIVLKDENVKRRIAEEVARQQSYLVGYFTKSSVPEIVVTQWAAISLSNPEFLKYISQQFGKLISDIGGYDILCGIETAGIALASATSMETKIAWIYARKERKKSGGLEAFEGTYRKGARVAFIDNFSAKGEGMAKILSNAKEEEFLFKDLFVIVDNEWEKTDKFNEYEIVTHCLITNRELTHYLNELNYFPGNLHKFVKMYLESPEKLKAGSDEVKKFVEELSKSPDLPYIRKNVQN